MFCKSKLFFIFTGQLRQCEGSIFKVYHRENCSTEEDLFIQPHEVLEVRNTFADLFVCAEPVHTYFRK